jgi:signal transduction histidine kinase
MKQIAENKDSPLLARTDLIRTASHDIQGAFLGVAYLGPLLKIAAETGEDPAPLLDHLIDACQDYKYRLGNFLEYTRFDAGIREAGREKASINIRSLMRRLVNENQTIAREKDIKISLIISGQMPEQIIGDEFRIAQIGANLLNNAIQFSPSGGPVGIKVEKEGESSWTLVVEDKGPGMTAGELNSVFSLLTTERKLLKNPGGLGLLVTRYLVEDIFKGKLTLFSEPQAGTTGKIVLPLSTGPVAE